MCFGGGDTTSNVKTPDYSPEEAHTAVETSQAQATGKTTDGAGLQETTEADGTVKTGNVGLKM